MTSKKFQKQVSFLFAVLGFAGAAQAGVFAQVDTEMSPNGKNIVSMTYVNYSLKVNDRYGLTTETRNDLTYRDGGTGKLKLNHAYLRVLLTDRNLAKLGAWTLENTYRYALPTTMGMQQDGSLGILTMRPGLKAQFGDFSMYARYGMNLSLQRRGYQQNNPAGAATRIYAGSLEFFPGYNITDSLAFTYQLALSHYHFFKPRSPKDKRWDMDFAHQPTLEYSPKSFNGAMVGIYFSHLTKIGHGEKFTLASKDGSSFGLELAKAF